MHAAALLVIDVQQGLDDPALGQRNNPDAEANMALLLQAWRRHGWPVIHVHHDSVEPDSPLRPGLPGNAVKPEVQPLPGETCFRKTVNSAFIGTGLEQYLREQGIASLVIVGLTTDHCVSASASMASDLGYGVTVVADATAAHEIFLLSFFFLFDTLPCMIRMNVSPRFIVRPENLGCRPNLPTIMIHHPNNKMVSAGQNTINVHRSKSLINFEYLVSEAKEHSTIVGDFERRCFPTYSI